MNLPISYNILKQIMLEKINVFNLWLSSKLSRLAFFATKNAKRTSEKLAVPACILAKLHSLAA